MCQLIDFEASNEEIESKIKIYVKNQVRYSFSEILTFGQRSTQKVKVNNSQHIQQLVNGLYRLGRFQIFRLGHRLGCKDANIILMTCQMTGR